MNMKLRNIPFSPPDMTEAEANEVREAILSGWITTGPRTKEFERLIAICCQTKKAVALNSATAAMELTLRVLGVGEGDEVIVPAYTYTATASVVHHVGAKIVMVDVAPDSFEIDYDRIADAITERTKVVTPISTAAATMSTPRNAKLMPTARASILVASARGSMVLKEKLSFASSSPPAIASLIMPPPITASSTKAIQWSILTIKRSNLKPSRKPIRGISA